MQNLHVHMFFEATKNLFVDHCQCFEKIQPFAQNVRFQKEEVSSSQMWTIKFTNSVDNFMWLKKKKKENHPHLCKKYVLCCAMFRFHGT